jgi:hypothetical protein
LRVADVEYLGAKEQQRLNKCITSQITDFEQATLSQISEKWKPITLAEGMFDLDELKKDISISDAKFATRKYKPTALILEYLTSRSATQQVPLPAFMSSKSTALRKKRIPDGRADSNTKRFRTGRQRSLFLLDQDAEEGDDEDDQHDEVEQNVQDPDAGEDDNWEAYAFEQRKSFSPCTTAYCKEKNIAHTHSTDRCYKLHPQNGKGGKGIKGSSSLLFTKGRKGSPKGKGKSKGKGKGKPGKGKGDRKGKRPKGKDTRGLGRSLDDTCHFCSNPGITKRSAPNLQRCLQKPAMAESGPNCLKRRFMFTTFWKTLWTKKSAGIACVTNATGLRAQLRWRHYYFTMPLNSLLKMACGTWSPAQSQAILR